MTCPVHGPCPICEAKKRLGDPRIGAGVATFDIQFTHWSKDQLIPYDGCKCRSCEEARQPGWTLPDA